MAEASTVAKRVREQLYAGLGEADRADLPRILDALLDDDPDPIARKPGA